MGLPDRQQSAPNLPCPLAARPGSTGAGHCHSDEEHQEEPQRVQEHPDVRASGDWQDPVCQGEGARPHGGGGCHGQRLQLWLLGMGHVGGASFPGKGHPSSTWWGPDSVHVKGRRVNRLCPPPPPLPLSRLETCAALRHGLCHHDRRGCGPHGAGRRDCHAQGLRLGQYQPARVSRAPPGMAPCVHALAWPGFLAATGAPAGGWVWGAVSVTSPAACLHGCAQGWNTLGLGVQGRNSPRE